MHLCHGIHLGYCTNIHRGESWEETLQALKDHTLRVKVEVAPQQPYGIGLRLSARAAAELSQPACLLAFQRWLEQNNCYIFTINGFPYGSFHGTRVKEQVFLPDWSSPQRLEYTNLLFDLLAQLLPAGISGSVSTLPGSHKTFALGAEQLEAIFANVRACREHIEKRALQSGRDLHLGFEPEPLGLFETSGETLKFFAHYLDRNPSDFGGLRFIGVNYDTCHLALQYEDAAQALDRLTQAGIRISKLHFSNALSLPPTEAMIARLRAFDEPVYFHQVVASWGNQQPLRRFKDLPDALVQAEQRPQPSLGQEWRVHFHIPLHAPPMEGFGNTQDHLLGAMDWLARQPQACQHLEMETYTWEVLPPAMRSGDVVDQLLREYRWTLHELTSRGLAEASS